MNFKSWHSCNQHITDATTHKPSSSQLAKQSTMVLLEFSIVGSNTNMLMSQFGTLSSALFANEETLELLGKLTPTWCLLVRSNAERRVKTIEVLFIQKLIPLVTETYSAIGQKIWCYTGYMKKKKITFSAFNYRLRNLQITFVKLAHEIRINQDVVFNSQSQLNI